MEINVDYQSQQQLEQTEPRLIFKQRVLKTVKIHKKRTNMDSVMGLIITAVVFLISLV